MNETQRMNPKVKARWLAALRSGEYKQGRGVLRNGDAFCCLGVICNLHAQSHPKVAAKQTTATHYMNESGVLPDAVAEWAGLPDCGRAFVTIDGRMTHLPSHNDGGKTFAQIADAIEKQL